MPNETTDQFTCDHCHETFDKAWTDEEARAEADHLWRDEQAKGMGMATICEDCFVAFMAWRRQYSA
jgi:hypothetical protein